MCEVSLISPDFALFFFPFFRAKCAVGRKMPPWENLQDNTTQPDFCHKLIHNVTVITIIINVTITEKFVQLNISHRVTMKETKRLNSS